jgi:hypothetical protein
MNHTEMAVLRAIGDPVRYGNLRCLDQRAIADALAVLYGTDLLAFRTPENDWLLTQAGAEEFRELTDHEPQEGHVTQWI